MNRKRKQIDGCRYNERQNTNTEGPNLVTSETRDLVRRVKKTKNYLFIINGESESCKEDHHRIVGTTKENERVLHVSHTLG